ncbi:MAG: hypothetical protein ACI8W3_001771 [Myxococcota bacterium]|jgi:hypothetical protein
MFLSAAARFNWPRLLSHCILCEEGRGRSALLLAAERRSVRQHEIDQAETFSLVAELAVGLAGFTGVAAAFGGRDRKYSDPDRVRILSIFLSAGCVLVGSLCVLTLMSAGWSLGQSYRWSGLSAAAVLIPSFYAVIPQSYAFAKDPDATTSFAIVAIGVLTNGLSVLLLAGNFIVWREAWPIFGAFSMQLVWGLFLFARVLMVRK